VFVEDERKKLILAMTGECERRDCGYDAIFVLDHAAAAVDQESDSRWRVLLRKKADVLRPAVFEYLK
jgi:hypothetical protein